MHQVDKFAQCSDRLTVYRAKIGPKRALSQFDYIQNFLLVSMCQRIGGHYMTKVL